LRPPPLTPSDILSASFSFLYAFGLKT
jgi:hypothetical protein